MGASSYCGLLIEFTLERAEAILLALSIDILLSPITVNTISKFNDFNKMEGSCVHITRILVF